MKPHEPVVSPGTPMPKGYGFLRKGNVYLTALCRRKTHEAKKTLYVVINKTKQEGLRAPKWILSEVFAEERATRSKRRVAVERRDAATHDTFESSIVKLFPKIPKHDVALILKRTLKKRSGRVGRTGTLELDDKARLAVQAHVRHCHTNYDKIIKGTTDRAAARRAVHEEILRVLEEWGGGARPRTSGLGNTNSGPKRKGHDLISSPRNPKRRRSGSTNEAAKVISTAKRKGIYKPGLKQMPKRQQTLGRTSTKPVPQPQVVIDLTLDETEPEDESEMSSDISCGEEYQESEDGDDDDLYELSDMVDSDGGYGEESDWALE